MAKKKKFYVVWEGNNPGIYQTWADCQLQIKGYPNARYKSFTSKAEADEAYHGVVSDYISNRAGEKKPKILSEEARALIRWDSISVDAACSGNPGDLEYRGVDTESRDELFRVGPFKKGTNNMGEFLALIHGLAYLKQIGQPKKPIYSDSRTAMSWVRKKQVNSKLKRSSINEPLFVLVIRGMKWLRENDYKNPILKWETKEWGEIPADFGRK